MRLVLLIAAALALAAPLSPLATASDHDQPADLEAFVYVEGIAFNSTENASFAAAARNVGGSPSGDFDYVVDIDGTVIQSGRLASLGPGAYTFVRFDRPRGEEGLVTLRIDASNEVEETDETNNVATFRIAYYDLTASLRLEPVPGKVLTQRAVTTVCNLDDGTATDAAVPFALTSSSGWRWLGSVRLPDIGAGECVDASLTLRLARAGSYRVHSGVAGAWDLDRSNNAAEADGFVGADLGAGVVLPVAADV